MPPQPTLLHKVTANVYDCTISLITLIDIIIDIIVTVIWYNQNRTMTFFWISISILILINLSYVIMFYKAHSTIGCGKRLLTLICLIPFAPILWIVWYFVIDENQCLRQFIDDHLKCFEFKGTIGLLL